MQRNFKKAHARLPESSICPNREATNFEKKGGYLYISTPEFNVNVPLIW